MKQRVEKELADLLAQGASSDETEERARQCAIRAKKRLGAVILLGGSQIEGRGHKSACFCGAARLF